MSGAPPEPRLGPLGGRYRLVERIGVGGMANVYRARDERLGRDVAIKVIAEWLANDLPSVRRFRREAQLTARLAHPGIVSFLDTGSDPCHYLALELVEGVDASALLRSHGRLPAGRVVPMVVEVCEALEHAHELGVIHGDVAPRNILIRGSDGAAKLADFGLARDANDAPGSQAGTGTPGYVAPEILSGSDSSPLSDLFSLGAIAQRLLGGPPLVPPGEPDDTEPLPTAIPRMRVLEEARPDLPRAVIDAVEQAVARDPANRQQSVAEFREQLVEAESAPARLRRRVVARSLEPARPQLRHAA